ncbi:MAG: hypothetical protein WCL32_20970 [Planctomycetota bacterium]
MTKFLIHEVTQLGSETILTGIVECGPVEIGSDFTILCSPNAPSDTWPVSLKVERIFAYNHELNDLPAGMSGKLHLRGLESPSLKHGLYLCSAKNE